MSLTIQGKKKDGLIGSRISYDNFKKEIPVPQSTRTLIEAAGYEAFFVLTDNKLKTVNAAKSNIFVTDVNDNELKFECRYHSEDFILIYVQLFSTTDKIFLHVTKEAHVRTHAITALWARYYWVLDLENGWDTVNDVSGNITDNSFTIYGTASYNKTPLGVPMAFLDGIDDFIYLGGSAALGSNVADVEIPWSLITGIDYDYDHEDVNRFIYGQGSSNSNNNILHIGFRNNDDVFIGYYNNDLNYDYTPPDGANSDHVDTILNGLYAFSTNGGKTIVDNVIQSTRSIYNAIQDLPLVSETGNNAFVNTQTGGYVGRFGKNSDFYFKGSLYDMRLLKTEITTNHWKLLRQNQINHNTFLDFSKQWEGYN